METDGRFDVIALDGDDTLWHNETIFSHTEGWFRDLLRSHASPERIDASLLTRERANLRVFGYGIKGFVLSMIETAIELTGGTIRAPEIQAIIDRGRAMLAHPVELLPGVEDTVEHLAGRYRLLLITKGDLLDQESKIARSGLAEKFCQVEIVSEKDTETYRRILATAEVDPRRFVMVGNSVRSDVLPVLELGGTAVHVPYALVWAHEQVEGNAPGYEGAYEVASIAEVPDLLSRLEKAAHVL